MARYTFSKTVSLSFRSLLSRLDTFLEGYHLEILSCEADHLIAREIPGQVPFPQLVTVEVSVDSARTSSTTTQMEVVVTNEELPLRRNNHCSNIFDQLSEALNCL